MKETTKSSKKNVLATDIEKIRETLLANATGEKPTYSVRVDLADVDQSGTDELMGGHGVYTRSSY